MDGDRDQDQGAAPRAPSPRGALLGAAAVWAVLAGPAGDPTRGGPWLFQALGPHPLRTAFAAGLAVWALTPPRRSQGGAPDRDRAPEDAPAPPGTPAQPRDGL